MGLSDVLIVSCTHVAGRPGRGSVQCTLYSARLAHHEDALAYSTLPYAISPPLIFLPHDGAVNNGHQLIGSPAVRVGIQQQAPNGLAPCAYAHMEHGGEESGTAPSLEAPGPCAAQTVDLTLSADILTRLQQGALPLPEAYNVNGSSHQDGEGDMDGEPVEEKEALNRFVWLVCTHYNAPR